MRGFNALTLPGWLTRLFSRGQHPLPAEPPSTAAPGQRWDFRFPCNLTGLAGFNAQLETRVADAHLPAADTFALHLLLDELLTNVIKYAHPGGGEHEVAVQLAFAPEHFEICIQDDGVPFDPTIPPPAPPPDADEAEPVALEDRTIGGWGLSLVRRTADLFEYQRYGEENHLRLLKRITPGAPAEGEAAASP